MKCICRKSLFVALGLIAFVAAENILLAGVMYWTDKGNVYRANLDGSNKQTIFTQSTAGGYVTQVDIDAAGKQLYFRGRVSEPAEAPFIRRANLDGNGIEDVTPIGLGFSLEYGFTVDSANRQMYLGYNGLRRANLDGSGYTALPPYYPSHPYYPHDIEVDTVNSKIYYTDAVSYNGIKRANLDGTGVQNVVNLGGGDYQNTYLALDVEGGFAYFTQYATHTLRRVNLNDLSQQTLIPDMYGWDIELDLSSRKMYWMSDTHILRADLTGANVETILQRDFGGPVGPATTGGTLALYLEPESVPEPAACMLAVIGVAAIVMQRWARRR